MYKFLATILILCLSACSGRPFSIIPSTSPLPPHIRGDIPTAGVDCQYKLLGVLPVTSTANTQAALQEAKDVAEADVLTDVTIDQTEGYYILFSNSCTHVRGLGVAKSITDSLRVRNSGWAINGGAVASR